MWLSTVSVLQTGIPNYEINLSLNFNLVKLLSTFFPGYSSSGNYSFKTAIYIINDNKWEPGMQQLQHREVRLCHWSDNSCNTPLIEEKYFPFFQLAATLARSDGTKSLEASFCSAAIDNYCLKHSSMSTLSKQLVDTAELLVTTKRADIFFETRLMKAIECECQTLSDWPFPQQIIKMKAASYASASSGDYDNYSSLAGGRQEGAARRAQPLFGSGLSYGLFASIQDCSLNLAPV